MDVKDWIIEWFSKKSDIEKSEIEKNIHEDYLVKCWIDSLKFVELITDIENHFNIKFSNDEFQDRVFSTVFGLVQHIETKIE